MTITALRHTGRSKPTTRRDRRYGILLDGGHLTAVTLDGSQAASIEQVQLDSPAAALGAWWAKVKPRDPVTVAVVSAQEEFAATEVDRAVPEDKLRRAIEAEVEGRFRRDLIPFAVAAHVAAASASPRRPVRVVGIPDREMAALWALQKDNLQFTVPAMAIAVDGIHLLAMRSSAELVCVSGGRVVDTFVLAAGGVPDTSAPGAPTAQYVRRLADEVGRVLNDWARSQLPVGHRQLFVTGPGALIPELPREIQQTVGWTALPDSVTQGVDLRPLLAADGGRQTNLLYGAVAAAAGAVNLDPAAYLARPGTDSTSTGRRRDPDASVSRIRRATAAVAGIGVVAAIGVIAVPSITGHMTLAHAQSTHQAAQVQVSRLTPDIEVYTFDHELGQVKTHDVKWAPLLTAVEDSLPGGVSIQTLKAAQQGDTVAVSATASASAATLVPQWLTTMTAKHWAPQTDGVTIASSGVTTFSVTFTVPNAMEGF